MRFCARPNKVIYSKKRNNQTESEEVQREETHPRKCRTQVGTQKKILQVNKNFQIDIFKYFMSEGFHKSRSTNCLKKLKCLISDTYSLGGGSSPKNSRSENLSKSIDHLLGPAISSCTTPLFSMKTLFKDSISRRDGSRKSEFNYSCYYWF